MRFKSTITIALALIGGLSIKAHADAPTTQPLSAPDDPALLPATDPGAPGDSSSSPGRGDHHRMFGGLFGRQPVLQEDLDKAREFMKTYSPERYKALQELRPEARAAIEDGTTRLYLNWQRLSKTDPDLYDVVLGRVKVEDRIFGLVGDLNKLGGGNLTDQQQIDRKSIKAELRETVGQLVELNLKERELRLNKLAATLKEQQAALDKDKDPSVREQLIDDRLKAVMNTEKQGFGSGRPHGHGDQGPPAEDTTAPHNP